MARTGGNPAGRMPVQLRFETGPAGAEYVNRELWRLASLPHCPLHPRGGCGLARHGTYERKSPPGTRIARWYCRQGHRTFSLLPDHLAARLPGTLQQAEAAVAAAEVAPSLQACADALRPDPVGLPSALRWLNRRVQPVLHVLALTVTLLAPLLPGCAPTLAALGSRLGVAAGEVLTRLRQELAAHLPALAAPLGFDPRRPRRRGRAGALQQYPGPDPPAAAA
jgi:hypothetical protein